MKIKKKKHFFFRGGGGQDGCELRIEVFVKIKKKTMGGGGVQGSRGGVRGSG